MNQDLIPIDIYKDPLKPYDKGFGYLGCLLQNKDRNKIQCHICGKMFGGLGKHVKTHDLTTREYKLKFGLRLQSSLLAPVVRENYIERSLNKSKEQIEKWKLAGKKALDKMYKDGYSERPSRTESKSLEHKNLDGSCPDQILEEIKKFHVNYGRVPSQRDFQLLHPQKNRYIDLARRTFGSWGNAIKKCGFELRESSGRKKGVKWSRWGKEDLKEILQIFTKENRRLPTTSDCLNGEIPSYDIFYTRFGGLENARLEAGVEEYI